MDTSRITSPALPERRKCQISVPVKASGDSETPKTPDKRACRGFRTFPEHPRRLISLPVGASDASEVLQATCNEAAQKAQKKQPRMVQNSSEQPRMAHYQLRKPQPRAPRKFSRVTKLILSRDDHSSAALNLCKEGATGTRCENKHPNRAPCIFHQAQGGTSQY